MSQGNKGEVKRFIWLLILILAVWTLYLFMVIDMTDRGIFGDMFGALNTLFSGFAFAGIVYAIFLQRRELSLQRQVLELTREEQRGQKEALEKQSASLRQANIQSVLYSLITEYQSAEMLNAIKELWNLKRESKGKLVERYNERILEEEKEIAKLPKDSRIKAIHNTIHFQRRLVSHFYIFLSGLRDAEAIDNDILYRYWGRGDLRIIPEVLIPIEENLADRLGVNFPWRDSIVSLYEDSPCESKEE